MQRRFQLVLVLTTSRSRPAASRRTSTLDQDAIASIFLVAIGGTKVFDKFQDPTDYRWYATTSLAPFQALEDYMLRGVYCLVVDMVSWSAFVLYSTLVSLDRI